MVMNKIYISSKLKKLGLHLIQGSLIERMKIEPRLRKERKWSKFKSGSKNYYIKNINKNVRMKLYKDSIISQAIFFDEFEQTELQFIRKILKPGDIFIDIGANQGIFSLIAANIVGPNGNVYSIEPAPINYFRLNDNIKLNNFSNVSTFQIALSNKKEHLSLKVSNDGYDAWNTFGIPTLGKKFSEIEVKVDTLYNFIDEKKIANILLIKIDVEGWEVPVLKGGIKLFSGINAPTILIEFSDITSQNAGYSCFELFNILKIFGYELFRYDATTNTLIKQKLKNNYDYVNLIATKNENDLFERIIQ